MALALQAIVSLDKSGFASGLTSLSQTVSNITGAMSMAFGGVASEILMMSKAFGPVGGAVAALKEAVTVGASFEQQIANVSSVSGLMGEELKKVEVAARDLAKTTRFTATEAGDALYSLASAGVSGADALSNTLKPALLLAGATMSSTTTATEAVTAALANFQIPAQEAARVADQFAGVIATSPATMERLSEAMKYAGPAAAGFGVSLEKTVAEVAAFHQAGLRGEMAGTSFRMALIQLSEAATKTETEIGQALKGWNASTEGVTGAVRRLTEAGVDSADVIQTLGARAGPGLAALMKMGADAMDEMAKRVAAAANVSKMYETQMNTLTGRFAVFKSAVEEVWLKLSGALSPALTALVQNMTMAIDWVGKLSESLINGNWQSAADQIKSLWNAIRDGAKAFDWMSAFDRLTGILDDLIGKISAFGAMILEQAGLTMTLEALRGAFETVQEVIGRVIGQAEGMAKHFRNVSWAEAAKKAVEGIDIALATVISTIEDVIKGVAALVDGWKNLSAEAKAVALAVTGTAGLTVGMVQLVATIKTMTTATAALAVAMKVNLISHAETAYIKLLLMGDAIKSVTLAQAGMVVGAAALGAGLGTLIRQIPGVADAMDNMTTKAGQFLGLVTKEDQALKDNLEQLKARRKAIMEAAEAQQEATVEITAANAAIGEQVMKQRELGGAVQMVTDAIMPLAPAVKEVKKEVELATGFTDDFKKSTYDANYAMAEELITMRRFAPVAADMAQVMEVTGVAMKTAAKETDDAKYSFDDLWGMLTKFKELKITGFDVSAFTLALKQLKQSLVDVDLPSLELPDFSGFKLPNISTTQVSKFVLAMQNLVERMKSVDVSGMAAFKFPDIKLPDLSASKVKTFITGLTSLKDGLMNLDFGALGGISVDIKGGGASEAVARLDKILAFLESKNGIIWA